MRSESARAIDTQLPMEPRARFLKVPTSMLSVRRSSLIVNRSFLAALRSPLCTKKNPSQANLFDLPFYLNEALHLLPSPTAVDLDVKMHVAFGLAKKDAEKDVAVAEIKQECTVAVAEVKTEAAIAIAAEKQRSKSVDAYRMQQLSSVSLRYVRQRHVVAHVRSTLLTYFGFKPLSQVLPRVAFLGHLAAVRRAVQRHSGRCAAT